MSAPLPYVGVPLVLDLFAGPGGWDEGVRPLGIHPRGIELDTAACDTGRAAGHYRHEADVAAMNPRSVIKPWGPCRGLIASPPCQGFSKAGKGAGMRDRHLLLSVIPEMLRRDVRPELHEHMADDRSTLVLEPLRWALALTPSWLAWEQVPAVLPIWKACADVLRSIGYSVATGVLNAEQHGVPQTRRRAILVARAPWATKALGPAVLPAPTHSRYHLRTPDRLDAGVAPWVSMADALDWQGFGNWQLASTTRPNSARRPLAHPAPTMAFGNDAASCTFVPAGTGDIRAAKVDGTARRITEAEAATLQTFPADYPWRGPKARRSRQIGDAVPPLLARAVVAEVAGLAVAQDAEVAA